MKISELASRTPVDEITVKVEDKDEPREVKGGALRVCDCKVSDDSGSVTLTLWNEDIDKVDKGDTVTITKGWVNEYQGKMQLSAGRFGEMSVTKGEGGSEEKSKEQPSEDVMDAMDEEII